MQRPSVGALDDAQLAIPLLSRCVHCSMVCPRLYGSNAAQGNHNVCMLLLMPVLQNGHASLHLHPPTNPLTAKPFDDRRSWFTDPRFSQCRI